MMVRAILVLVMAATLGTGALGADLDMSAFAGLWVVDVDRTLEAAKDSPTYDEKMAAQMPQLVEHVLSTLQMTVTDSNVVYSSMGKDVPFPYSVKSSDETSVTVVMTHDESESVVTFTVIDDVFMGFTSSSSDDTDYYVWTKLVDQQAVETP